MVKSLARSIYSLLGAVLIGYLGFHWFQGSINFAYIGSLVPVFWVVVLLLIVWLILKAWHVNWPRNKRIIVVWWVLLIVLAHEWFTDTGSFRWWDISSLFGTITIFFSLFGFFTEKQQSVKWVYTKKTEIIEV